MEKDNEIDKQKELILEFLKESPTGETITAMTNKLKISRYRVNQILMTLLNDKKIRYHVSGTVKLFFIEEMDKINEA